MRFQRIVDDAVSYLVLPEFWVSFWPFVVALLLVITAGLCWARRKTLARFCLKMAAVAFFLGLLWITLLL